MRVGQWPRVPLHRTSSSISRAFRQKHRSPEPDCPRRSSLPGIPETASLGPDQSPQRRASSDPSANGVGIIPRESNNQMRFHTVTVSNWTAFFTANPEALQDRTVTQAAFGSAFGDAVGTALLAPTSSNLMTVFSTIAGNGFSPNTVRGLVANALIDNAEGLYTAGVSLTALPRHVLLQGNSTGGRANIPCGPASP